MERIQTAPRKDWKEQVESLGLAYHTVNNRPYWCEQACYHFEAQEIEAIKTATNEIEQLCLHVVDHVIAHRRYSELNIPEYAWPLIEASWRRSDKPLYGRMDFSYDGVQPPKLLEYNAATPLCLLESSLVQRHWLEQVRPGFHQFNQLHDALVRAWASVVATGGVHLTCREKIPWLLCDTTYLASTAKEAGFATKIVFIEKIGWNGREYVDEQDEIINTLFKLCSWEWMLEDVFSNLLKSATPVIEPAWKMILANKGLLVLLWELFPDHPNLLPASFDKDFFRDNYVRKALLGREGENIDLYTDQGLMSTAGAYAEGPFIYQRAHLLPNFDGNYPMIGSWLVAGQSVGMVIREDDTPITCSLSRIVPHFFS